MHILESERLYVRYFTMDDQENFFRMYGDEEIMRYIRATKNREECAEFLKEVIGRYETEKLNLRMALVQKDSNVFVGAFGLIPLEKTTDTQMGYTILKEHWGKGYATEIVKAGLAHVFGVLGFSSIVALTQAANMASQKVLLKNGFVLERTQEQEGKQVNTYRKLKDQRRF